MDEVTQNICIIEKGAKLKTDRDQWRIQGGANPAMPLFSLAKDFGSL